MRFYKTVRKLLIVLTFCFLFTNVFAQTENQKAELPPTNFGKVIRQWLDLIDSGTESEMKTFVENNFSTDAIRSQSVAETVFIMQKLQKQSGGLEILSVMPPPQGEFPTILAVKSKRGANYAQVMIAEDSREPNKIIGFGVRKSSNANSKIKWA
jgi:hypothetical protein